jgi:multidrug resistance efflux pump
VASYSRVGRCYRFCAVPNEAYIIANFKETQIAYVRVGRSVSVRVDALPGEKLRGDRQLPRREGFELRAVA